jgi:hypothetical protein
MARNFCIKGLAKETITSLLSNSQEEVFLKDIVVDEKNSFPCRVSLKDAEVGEKVLLLNFRHHNVHTAYRSSGPIIIRERANTVIPEAGTIPEILSRRHLSLRGYDTEGMMVNASTIDGTGLENNIGEFFAIKAISYIHIHNARQGCYLCAVERL